MLGRTASCKAAAGASQVLPANLLSIVFAVVNCIFQFDDHPLDVDDGIDKDHGEILIDNDE